MTPVGPKGRAKAQQRPNKGPTKAQQRPSKGPAEVKCGQISRPFDWHMPIKTGALGGRASRMWPTLSQVVALLEHLQPLQFDWATRTAGELMNYDLQSTANILIATG